MSQKEHWEKVFETKAETEVSWYQKTPQTSLSFASKLAIPKEAKIIDIGGGDSYLVDALLEHGFTNITVLDISAKAIERLKNRLGDVSNKVTFVVSDVLDFEPKETYDLWHDRASFHFQTDANHIEKYATIVSRAMSENGHLVIGTFSENGPLKCSGLEITQYSESKMKTVFESNFEFLDSMTENHTTPFDTIQNFIFCSFKRK